MKRNTWQKQRIEEELEKIDTFFTAEDLHKKLKKDNIGIATIYRFLNEKKDKEIFSYICDRKQTFSKENKSHCHFICEKTGKIIHFNIDSLDFLKNKIPGSIKSFQIEIKGICDTCSTHKNRKV
jgi:Fe2+ or Zn2+ uptake regulation protein